MDFKKRWRNWRNLNKPPTLAMAPAPAFGQYNPNTGIYSGQDPNAAPFNPRPDRSAGDTRAANASAARDPFSQGAFNASGGQGAFNAQGYKGGYDQWSQVQRSNARANLDARIAAGTANGTPAGPAGPGSGTSRGAPGGENPNAYAASGPPGTANAAPGTPGSAFLTGQTGPASDQFTGPVAAAQVQGSAYGRDAAMGALQNMQQVARSGWTDLDRRALDSMQRQSSQYEQSQRQANQQSMAARGMRGSGLDMLGAMTAQQGGADRALDQATILGVQGRDRALQANQNAASLGLGIDTQQFGQGMQRAQAVDDFNRYALGQNNETAQAQYNMDLQNRLLLNQLHSQQNGAIASGASNVLGGMFSFFGGDD